MRHSGKGCRLVAAFALCVGLSLVFPAVGASGQASGEPPLFVSARPPLKVLAGEEALWVLHPNSSEVIRYSWDGRITGGCNVAASRGLLAGARITAHDLAWGADGSLHVLVGAVNLKTDEIASYVVRCTEEKMDLLRLSEPVAAFRLGLDGQGTLYILGLREPDFRDVDVGRQRKGTYPVVHRFSREGALLGSYLRLELDPTTPESHANTVGNPFHARGNFAVESDGTAWVVWYHFPPPAEAGCLPFEVCRVSPDGAAVCGLPPGTAAAQGCCFDGLLPVEEGSGVAMVLSCPDDSETLVVDSRGRELDRGPAVGRVLAFRGGRVLAGARVGPGGQFSVRVVRRGWKE